MEKIRKILAIVLTFVMVLGMSMTVFAATETSRSEATILGVEDEANITVKAYQIIKYNEAGYYEEVLPDSITKNGDNLAPNGNDVQELAQKTGLLTNSVTFIKQNDGKYTYSGTDLTPGTWMVIITGSQKYLYNPAIISVNKDAAGNIYGTLNLDTDTWGDTVYAKKSEPDVKKEAITPAVQGVQYGDIIQFKITADIPDYTDSTVPALYKISDHLNGLALVVDEQHPYTAVLNDTNETLVPVADGTFVNGATSFTIDLSSNADFIKAHRAEKIIVTYYAKVTSSAKITVDEANNTAKLEYSTNDGTQSKEKTTRHYTFGIDTTLSGTESSKTNEFIKTDDNGNISMVEGEIVMGDAKPLAGAEFQLHIGAADGPVYTNAEGKSTFTTNDQGLLEINGLDSDVQYYLVETKAPTGYTINSTPIPVKIDAVYDVTTGKLQSYTVKIDGKETLYNYNPDTKVTTKSGVGNPYQFKNTKLTNLPSTGGIGTTIFTIGGCLFMILAAGMFFTERKKEKR